MGGAGSGRKPRDYPNRIVEQVCARYLAGATIRELRPEFPGYRVQTILERHLPERRKAAKRNQVGPANHMWRDRPGYQAAHLRVEAVKGKAACHPCVDCDLSAADWSYVRNCRFEVSGPGHPPYCLHPDHYQPRCRVCHRAYDQKEVVPHV